MNKKPKIAVIHDSFLYRGGGERLVTMMAESLGADLISGFFSEGSFDPRELGFTGKMIPLGKPVFKKGIRHLVLKWRFFWYASILREYDLVIFSGDCLGAMRHISDTTETWYYCHTPPRYLYDFRTRYLAQIFWGIRPFFAGAFTFFAWIYENHLKKFDRIFTNARTTHKRLMEFCHMESEILYPPIDITRFTPDETTGSQDHIPHFPQKSYYFSWARLSPPKRVDMIVDAFLEMPDQNLIFTYGRNDPMKGEILRKIEGHKNIQAIESPIDDALLTLIRGASATIYIPVDEDFGMTPIESMACGIPVIASTEGELVYTVTPDITGKCITIVDRLQGISSLKSVTQSTTSEEWENMKGSCRDQAEQFSLEKFQEKLQFFLGQI